SAFLSRFCTSTCARSGWVPGSKVTVISAMPLELLVDSKYSSPLAPLSSSSITLVTESTSTFADAPGYVAVTEICGGATLGYCATGSSGMTSKPAMEMNSATTHAKLGRLMKNRDMVIPRRGRTLSGRVLLLLEWLRSDRGIRSQAVQPANHDPITDVQSAANLPAGSLHYACIDLAQLGAVLRIDDPYLGGADVVALDRPLRHQNGLVIQPLGSTYAHVHTRQQHAVGVGELAAHRQLARAALDRNVAEQQLALALVVGALDFQRQGIVSAR